MSDKRLDAAIVRKQVADLIAAYPELADDDILRADMFEAETDLHEYLDFLEKRRRHALAQAKVCSLEIEEYKQRRDRFERRDESLRAAMFKILQAIDVDKVELAIATVSVRKGNEKTVIYDEAALPDQFVKVTRTPDRIAIKAALKADAFGVPGASLSNAGPSLVINTK
jgi:hypothetical protein